MDDAARVQELAGDKEIAKTTLGMPHHYPIEAAENWIKNHPKLMEEGMVYPLAMKIKDKNELIGTMIRLFFRILNLFYRRSLLSDIVHPGHLSKLLPQHKKYYE
jgi:hypothetical protein